VGHPLDTVKVRLQAGLYKSTFHCVSTTLKNEGIRGFFKGLTAPLVGNVPINAILFAGYEHGIRILRIDDPHSYQVEDRGLPPLLHVALAGGWAGLLQSVAMCKCPMKFMTTIISYLHCLLLPYSTASSYHHQLCIPIF
jgi:hypothetical protein